MKKNKELNPVGPSFEELTLEEMISSQGSGDVKPQTTIPCAAISVEITIDAATMAYSYFSGKCK